MAEHPIQGLMGVTMEKIREMVDADTIVGAPINAAEGVTILPISKVTFGFASGGSDIGSKTNKDLFGGGGGAGVSISPIAFLVIQNGNVRTIQLADHASTVDRDEVTAEDVMLLPLEQLLILRLRLLGLRGRHLLRLALLLLFLTVARVGGVQHARH